MSEQIKSDVALLIVEMDESNRDGMSTEAKVAFARLVVGVLTDLHRLADASELIAKHIRNKKPLLDE